MTKLTDGQDRTDASAAPDAHAARAARFRELHQTGLLVLANAWDAGSARLIEHAGAKAVATTSAAVAWAHGYADGDLLPVPLLVATVTDIVRAIRVPLSVDVEGGYSDDPAAVGETVARLLDAGAVGINIEDGAGAPDLLCAKIEQVKRAAAARGVDLFVNARTDVYLRGQVAAERRVDETLARAGRYRAAGADGIFVPVLSDASQIQAIVAGVSMPLNVMSLPGLPAAPELTKLGVRRLSAGAAIAQVIYARIGRLAEAFLRTGESAPLAEGAMAYAELNALMDAARSA